MDAARSLALPLHARGVVAPGRRGSQGMGRPGSLGRGRRDSSMDARPDLVGAPRSRRHMGGISSHHVANPGRRQQVDTEVCLTRRGTYGCSDRRGRRPIQSVPQRGRKGSSGGSGRDRPTNPTGGSGAHPDLTIRGLDDSADETARAMAGVGATPRHRPAPPRGSGRTSGSVHHRRHGTHQQ